MGTKLGVAFTATIMAALLIATLYAGVQMLLLGDTVVFMMGVALIILALIASWALIVELKFGFESNKLINRYLDEGREPVAWSLATTSSGRILPKIAVQERDKMREAEALSPEDWRIKLELGFLEAAAGKKPLGRKATREAIELAKAQK